MDRVSGLLPIDTCPVEYTELVTGRCASCDRWMVRKKTSLDLYTLLMPWFVRAANQRQCGSCYSRGVKRCRPKRTARQRREFRPPMTSAQLVALRILVGACPECGWAQDDDGEGHGCRDCGLFEESRRRVCTAA